jgi:HK97 gp10 family phage protein
MSAALKVKVNETAFTKYLTKLKALENDFAREVDDEMAAAGLEIVTLAKQNAPTDFGRLKNAIKSNKLSLLRHEVSVNVNYAAYVEFGTGKKYRDYSPNLTNEWKNIAADFFKTGKGTTRPQPYLYPAAKLGMAKLKERFLKLLKALLKK